ncbi:pseudouridine synthase [Calidifontibacillus oryziterrae]|uniref:pseudouridine synthase n=1 Tax=Calidifontibacillus oryziterrae TaxID=1191699 RepID=UPI0002DABF72|nr:pseudouridine synthase [Calidifontibacillus oryziterrae]
MRIDKFLANSGFGSRKEVKKLLKTGAVKINDEVVKDSQTQLTPEVDGVTVHGEIVEYKEYIYLMMNKPSGVISATEDNHETTVIDLLELDDQRFEPFPVGRLDKDTVGLLILTNDGKLAHRLLSPKKHVPKTYYAKIEGVVTEDDIERFRSGVTLEDGYITKPAELVILSSGNESEIELTITEGKFHQVKRMFIAVGKKVSFLMRIKMGPLLLDQTLKQGEYRDLTNEEIELLKSTT